MSNTLTPKAEEILKEILDHRDEKGNCDLKYWEKKFNDYSFTETSFYCDGFRELKNDDLITVKWAEGCPYILFPTNKGLSHFEQKKQAERMKRKEKQSSFWHDILVAAIGAVFGGIVTFLLFKCGVS